jgi:hypothetical protein
VDVFRAHHLDSLLFEVFSGTTEVASIRASQRSHDYGGKTFGMLAYHRQRVAALWQVRVEHWFVEWLTKQLAEE